jgi:hypothetical protein
MKRGIQTQKLVRCADCGAVWPIPRELTGRTRCPGCSCKTHVGSSVATEAVGASEVRPGKAG